MGELDGVHITQWGGEVSGLCSHTGLNGIFGCQHPTNQFFFYRLDALPAIQPTAYINKSQKINRPQKRLLDPPTICTHLSDDKDSFSVGSFIYNN